MGEAKVLAHPDIEGVLKTSPRAKAKTTEVDGGTRLEISGLSLEDAGVLQLQHLTKSGDDKPSLDEDSFGNEQDYSGLGGELTEIKRGGTLEFLWERLTTAIGKNSERRGRLEDCESGL